MKVLFDTLALGVILVVLLGALNELMTVLDRAIGATQCGVGALVTVAVVYIFYRVAFDKSL